MRSALHLLTGAVPSRALKRFSSDAAASHNVMPRGLVSNRRTEDHILQLNPLVGHAAYGRPKMLDREC